MENKRKNAQNPMRNKDSMPVKSQNQKENRRIGLFWYKSKQKKKVKIIIKSKKKVKKIKKMPFYLLYHC